MEDSVVDGFLTEWHRIIREKDAAAFPAILAENVAIGPPPYWNRLEGKDTVAFLLGVILNTIENFEYRREWRDGAELALEFTGNVEGKSLQGIDLITVDSDGLLARIDVPMRPVEAINILMEKVQPQMMKYLESLAGGEQGEKS
jgi:hypothetical protein